MQASRKEEEHGDHDLLNMSQTYYGRAEVHGAHEGQAPRDVQKVVRDHASGSFLIREDPRWPRPGADPTCPRKGGRQTWT